VPALTEGETARRFFRTAIPDPYFTQQLNEQIATKVPAGGRIALISREDAYGAEVGLSLTDGLVALGYDAVPTTYGPNVVLFDDLAKTVAASQPLLTIVVSIGEGEPLIGDLITAGLQPSTIVGLDGVLDPRLAEQVSPTDPSKTNGLNVVGTTGSKDLFSRLIAEDAKAPVVYAAQAYDCAVSLTLASLASNGTDSDQIAANMVAVTQQGTTCSTFADCRDKLVAGEDIDYDGPSGAIRSTTTAIRPREVQPATVVGG
jgi:branched-chain amino acid transport system substrate-binding protein